MDDNHLADTAYEQRAREDLNTLAQALKLVFKRGLMLAAAIAALLIWWNFGG